MKILLDTCEFLWLITGDPKLSPGVAAAICDPANQVFLSSVSYWEISVKHSLAKLPLPESPARLIPGQRDKHQIASLVLDEAAVSRLDELPPLHRDPFDRMLVCQAQAHGLVIASSDALIRQYPVPVL
jgi:PIN domain nuclease of toxin-antitoxin system